MTDDTPAAQPPATDRDAELRALVSDWQANGNSRAVGDPTADAWLEAARQLLDALDALAARPAPACHCEPCPGRGTDGHGMEHCAECCFGTHVIAEIDCPVHGDPAARPAPDTLADRVQALHRRVPIWVHADWTCAECAEIASLADDLPEWPCATAALLAGRSDASPEGGA